MQPDEIWGLTAADPSDSPGEGKWSEAVLHPTVDLLAGLSGDGAALELAIGTGRVAIPLAEWGVPVTGIEQAAPMVGKLHERIGTQAIPVTLGDMTTSRVEGEFSLVYLVFNTISNLLTQDEQVECFRNAARHVARLCRPRRLRVLDQKVVSHHLRYGRGREASHAISPHRFVWPAELDLMGRLAGFELEARYADWDRSAFIAHSRSHVSVYRLAPR